MKREPKQLRYLEAQPVEKLLSACSNYRDYLLIRALWKTGCRISEVLALTGDGVDIQRGTITVPALKLKVKGSKYPILDTDTRSSHRCLGLGNGG